jgi:hypothetical protein
MRRRKLLVALAGLAMVVAAGTFILWPRAVVLEPRPLRATRQNYDRIRIGITRAEVEASLGPPGDYTTGPTHPTGRDHGVEGSSLVCASVTQWLTDNGSIVVEFDARGRVRGWSWGGTQRVEQGPLDTLLWNANRQWHRWFP